MNELGEQETRIRFYLFLPFFIIFLFESFQFYYLLRTCSNPPHHFLLKHRAKVGKRVEGFTPAALAKLATYDFPGNVRELENKVHHALVMAQGEYIRPEDIAIGPPSATRAPGIDLSRRFRDLKKEVVEAFEEEYTREILKAHRGNLAAAARQAGMDRKNLWSLAKKYNIDLKRFRTGEPS